MKDQIFFQNPHLEGDSFFWEGNSIGIMLIHGFTATTAEIRPLARRLRDQGYTVSGPLLPGHGTTIEDLNHTRWQTWVESVNDAYHILSKRCELVFIGGESMGGLLALYLASEHPEIAGVMAYAPALKITSWTAPLLAPLTAPFIQYRPKPESKASPTDQRWQGYRVNPVRASAELFRLQRQVRRRLSRIDQPLLIIQGRLDGSVDPAVPEIIAKRTTSAVCEIHWFDNSGHCIVLDRELEQVANQTRDFIRKHSPESSG